MDLLRGLGVQQVIDRSAGNVALQVRQALSGARLDVSFNAVGGSSFSQDMRLLGSGGRMVLYGGSERAGIGVFGTLRFVLRMGPIIPIFLMMRSRSILGVNMLRISEHHSEIIAEGLDWMVRALLQGELRVHVHDEFPADRLPAAIAALGRGSTAGKLVVRW
jgi:NADPH2:quinone reductase